MQRIPRREWFLFFTPVGTLAGAGLVFYFRKVNEYRDEDEDEIKRIEIQISKYRESKQEEMQQMEIGDFEPKGIAI